MPRHARSTSPRCRAPVTPSGNANPSSALRAAPLARFGGAPLLPHPPARITGGCVATPLCAPPAPHWSLRSLAPLRGCPALPDARAADGAARLILSPRSPRCEHCHGQRTTRHNDDSRSAPLSPRTMPVGTCPGKTWPVGVACHAACVQSPRHRCAASPPHNGRRGRSACHVTHIVRSFAGAPTPKRIRGKRTAHTC